MAILLYTSGTTGKPKGVMLSHNNMAKNAIGTAQNVYLPESNLLILPLHHGSAVTMGVLIFMLIGASVAINKSLKYLQSDMLKYKPRNIFMVPLLAETLYKQICAMAKKSDNQELSALSAMAFGENFTNILCGGAPLNIKCIVGFREFGIFVAEGYGITECSPAVSVNRNLFYRDGSVGQVMPCCEVKIIRPVEEWTKGVY